MKCLTYVLMASVLVMVGCHSVPLTIPTAPLGPGETVVGEAQGSSTGLMLFQIFPINQNDRFVSAYQNALDDSGGDRLMDVTISETWFWAYILNGYKFTVSGTAVRKK